MKKRKIYLALLLLCLPVCLTVCKANYQNKIQCQGNEIPETIQITDLESTQWKMFTNTEVATLFSQELARLGIPGPGYYSIYDEQYIGYDQTILDDIYEKIPPANPVFEDSKNFLIESGLMVNKAEGNDCDDKVNWLVVTFHRSLYKSCVISVTGVAPGGESAHRLIAVLTNEGSFRWYNGLIDDWRQSVRDVAF